MANALAAKFSKGDAIAIDMPMTATAVIIYLAIVLAGLVVVSIADSFAAQEIATRLRVSKARAVFTQVVQYNLYKSYLLLNYKTGIELVYKYLMFSFMRLVDVPVVHSKS